MGVKKFACHTPDSPLPTPDIFPRGLRFHFDKRPAQGELVFEEQSEAANYGALRAFGQAHGEVGLSRKPLVEAGQERRASGQDHSAVVNVAGSFWRQRLERVLDRADDADDDGFDGVMNFEAVDDGHFGVAGDGAAALDHGGVLLVERDGAAEFDLDALGGARADQQAVVLFDHVDQRDVHVVAAESQRAGEDQVVVNHRGDGGRARADVDDEGRALVVWVDAGAEDRHVTFVDEMYVGDAGLFGRVAQRVTFDVAGVGGDRNQHAPRQRAPVARLADIKFEQFAREGRVGHDAVLQRADDLYVFGSAPFEFERFQTDGDDLARRRVVRQQ